jgi:HTH-type transcriptional regulator / antitoxin HipB
MKTFRKHLNNELKNEEFKKIYQEENELMELSLEIVTARKELGLSQNQLAEMSHITQQQLSKIENGINCNMLTFLKVCDALGIEIDLHKKKVNAVH